MESSRPVPDNRLAANATARSRCLWSSTGYIPARSRNSSLLRLSSRKFDNNRPRDTGRKKPLRLSVRLESPGSELHPGELTALQRRDAQTRVLRARSSPACSGDGGMPHVSGTVLEPVQRACMPRASFLRSSLNLQQFAEGKPQLPQSVGAAALMSVAALCFCLPGPAFGFEIRTEPANALSLPTWAIHVSSVLEWVTAMVLFWRLAEASGTFASNECLNPPPRYLQNISVRSLNINVVWSSCTLLIQPVVPHPLGSFLACNPPSAAGILLERPASCDGFQNGSK